MVSTTSYFLGVGDIPVNSDALMVTMFNLKIYRSNLISYSLHPIKNQFLATNLGVAYIHLDSQLEVNFFYGTKYKLIEIEGAYVFL